MVRCNARRRAEIVFAPAPTHKLSKPAWPGGDPGSVRHHIV